MHSLEEPSSMLSAAVSVSLQHQGCSVNTNSSHTWTTLFLSNKGGLRGLVPELQSALAYHTTLCSSHAPKEGRGLRAASALQRCLVSHTFMSNTPEQNRAAARERTEMWPHVDHRTFTPALMDCNYWHTALPNTNSYTRLQIQKKTLLLPSNKERLLPRALKAFESTQRRPEGHSLLPPSSLSLFTCLSQQRSLSLAP